jgi:hypothetical protein
MALTIVSRESAGLPPVPSSIGRRALSSWAGIKVHHTGGAFSSWKAVHDWQTAGRPVGERLAYIGYSFGVAGGRVTELRGWDRQPAHDHENSTLGVVFGGNFTGGLPAAADLAAFVEFVRLARTRVGRAVPVTGHRDTWPAGDWRYSSCPGDRLYAHLPALRRAADEGDDDVELLDKVKMADDDGNRWSFGRILNRDAITVNAALGYSAAGGWQMQRDVAPGVAKLLAGQAALLAKLGGEDVTTAVRAELDRHRAALVAELGEGLAEAVAAELADVPAEVVEAAVGRALARTSLTVDPA